MESRKCASYTFRYLDSKNYGAHHLDFIIGDLEHLDHILDTSHHLDTKIYEARHLDFIISHRESLDPALYTFRHVDASYIYPWFSTVSKVNSAALCHTYISFHCQAKTALFN